MNELQKKVLLFLLQELQEQVREMSCDESEIDSLSEEDRRLLSQMLFIHWEDEEDWDGRAQEEFSVSSLISLAQYWLTGKKD